MISTYKARARMAWLHKTHSVYWIVIGRTTAWEDEAAPPSPVPSDGSIEEAICFVKAEYVSLCKSVSTGQDVTVKGLKYAFVADEDAIDESARFLYIRGRFDPSSGQPYGIFRVVGVYTNLIPATGHDEDIWLAPSDVEDAGLLERIENSVYTVMSTEREEIIQILIEYK